MINYPFPRPATPPGCKNLPVTNMIQQVPYFHTYSHSQMCVQVYQSSGQTHNQESVGCVSTQQMALICQDPVHPPYPSSIGTIPYKTHQMEPLPSHRCLSLKPGLHCSGTTHLLEIGSTQCMLSCLFSPLISAPGFHSLPPKDTGEKSVSTSTSAEPQPPLQSQQALGTSWCLQFG